MSSEPLVRDRADAAVGGVCGALAKGWGLDPLLVRIGFIVLIILTGGVALVGYVALWFLTPSRLRGTAPAARWFPFVDQWEPTALVMVVLGGSVLLGAMLSGSGPGILIPLLLLWWVMRTRGASHPPTASARPAPRTPFERLAMAWEQRLANVDAGRPADWAPGFAAMQQDQVDLSGAPAVGSPAHRRRGRRSWFGILVGVVLAWSACGTASQLGVGMGPLAWTSATLAVLAIGLIWSARPSRAVLGRPPLLGTVTVLTGLLTVSLLLGSVATAVYPQHRFSAGLVSTAPLTSGATDLGLGDFELDYTDTPVTSDSHVTYDLAVGDLNVTVPRRGNVVVTSSVGIGSIDTPSHRWDGVNLNGVWRRDDTPDGPTLTIEVRLRTGDVRVVEP